MYYSLYHRLYVIQQLVSVCSQVMIGSSTFGFLLPHSTRQSGNFRSDMGTSARACVRLWQHRYCNLPFGRRGRFHGVNIMTLLVSRNVQADWVNVIASSDTILLIVITILVYALMDGINSQCTIFLLFYYSIEKECVQFIHSFSQLISQLRSRVRQTNYRRVFKQV